MLVNVFDLKKGIYSFGFTDLETEVHAHPVVEVIWAESGTFTLESPNFTQDGLKFAIIGSNKPHKLVATDCTFTVLMIESHNQILPRFLSKLKINFESQLFTQRESTNGKKLLSEIEKLAKSNNLFDPTETRIAKCIQTLNDSNLTYKNLITTLTKEVNLSSSRLSHLFKQEIGISIKKYLVWVKLQKAIQHYLKSSENLTNASFESGFFDQAHLSKSFKSILGVNPNKAYNSRILQF